MSNQIQLKGELNYWLRVIGDRMGANDRRFSDMVRDLRDVLACAQGSPGDLRYCLRDSACPRPANSEPDDLTVGQCFDKGHCGCQNGAALRAPDPSKAWAEYDAWADFCEKTEPENRTMQGACGFGYAAGKAFAVALRAPDADLVTEDDGTGDVIYRGQPGSEAVYPASPADKGEVVAHINARLEDLETANALYGKDQRLNAPEKIDRNKRELSWLKDLKSMIVLASPAADARMREMAAVTSFLKAWDALPVGDHSVAALQRWLNSAALKAGIEGLRSLPATPSERLYTHEEMERCRRCPKRLEPDVCVASCGSACPGAVILATERGAS